MLFLPLIQTVLFNVACGHDPKHLALGVLNEEIIAGNPEMCRSASQTKSCFMDGGVSVSCLLLDKLKEKTFELVIITQIFAIFSQTCLLLNSVCLRAYYTFKRRAMFFKSVFYFILFFYWGGLFYFPRIRNTSFMTVLKTKKIVGIFDWTQTCNIALGCDSCIKRNP